MKPEELSDYIGEIDDELITNAKIKHRTSKRLFLIMGGVAACAAIAVIGVYMLSSQNTTVDTSIPVTGGYTEKGAEISSGITAGGANSEIPHTEESEEIVIETVTSSICYVKDGRIEKTPIEHEARPEAVFELWKKMNSIGDDVRFISVTLKTNGSTEETEYNGQGVATYHFGDGFIYNLTITKNIEDYYFDVDKTLLLESLKQTMLCAADVKTEVYIKVNDYNLILAEG